MNFNNDWEIDPFCIDGNNDLQKNIDFKRLEKEGLFVFPLEPKYCYRYFDLYNDREFWNKFLESILCKKI